jgi:hypothetical protein
MKKLSFILTLLSIFTVYSHQIQAQTFGNEWISYQKPYAKVAVLGNETGTGNQGIYRITYAQLAQADFPVTEDPRRFQMFNKGKEIAIRVVGEQDGRFDRNDYIEFWSKGNLDGIDAEMYENPADAPNPYIPIYDSFGMYFVTLANNPKRMVYSYENSATLPIETAHTQEMIYAPSETFNRGSLFPTSIVNRDFGATAIMVSHFTPNKAVSGYPSFAGVTLTIPFGFENFIQNTSVDVETNFSGAVNAFNEVTLFYNNKSIGKVGVVNYARGTINTKIDSVKLNGNFNLTYTNTSTAPLSSIAPHYFRVNYRQGFDMGQRAYRKFMLDAKSAGKSKIVLQGVNDRTIIYDITDEYNVKLIGYDSAGNQRTAVVPNTAIRRTLVAESRINSVASVTKVTFEPLNISANFLIVAPKHLMAAVGNVPDVIKEYANYRETGLGGNYTSTVVDIQQLYNQFCYGYFNPLAIRRYADYMLRVNVNPPKALFIIGRGVQLTNFYRNGTPRNFIPPFGYPSSDNEFTNGLGGNPRFVPKIPVGRLVAETPQEVMNYLNKVKEHEALAANVAWRKNIVHLSGGTYENENKLFNTYMNGYKSVVDIGFRGSKVKTIRKSTSDYVEYINLKDELNAGLSLITMFGHSGASFSDVEIGQPNDTQTGYNNKGKYPMILQNGCSSANVFRVSPESSDARRDYRTPSEYWIVTPDKGALLYLANTSFGEAGNLNLYTRYFYEVAFNDIKYANASIGEIMQETIRRFVAINDVEMGTAHAQQMLLQGDPAIVMFGKRSEFAKPDYVVEDKNLFVKTFNNERLNAASDSFQICMAVANTGIVNLTPFTVSVKRTFNDFSFIQYPTKIYPAIRNLDTICFTITTPKDVKPKALGLNQFEIKVDYENRIDELDEQNNTAFLSFTLKKATMLPIAPKEYSIASSQPVYFVAQNTDAFTRERTYRFQLDTSYLFNSSYKKDTVVTSYIVAQWTTNLLPDIKANDSTVYYWRIRYADLRPEDDTTWVSSSFVYIKDSPSGWSQSRFPQYTKNVSKGVAPSIANKRWIFPEVLSKIDVNVVPYDGDRNNGKWKSYYMNLNDQLYAYETSCTQQSFSSGYLKLLCLAIDQQTGEPYNPALGLSSFSSVGHPCGTASLVAAIASDGGFLQYISLVKQGDYIVMMPAGDLNLSSSISSSAMVAAFAGIGVSRNNLQQLGYNLSFFIVGQKGASQPLNFQVAAAGQSIKTSYTIRRQAYEGSVNSTLIGPAASWGNVFRTINGFDNPKDTWRMDVVGVDFNGNENLLFGNIKPDAFDIKNIDAKANPYLRLKLQVADSLRKTPYQLQRWQVVYKEVPEGILLYDTLTYRENTVLQVVEGDSVKMKFNFLNISGNDFPEPLTVQYRIRNANTGKDTTITEKMKKQLLRNQFQAIEVKLNSLNFKGDNTLTVFVNPRIQAEQFYENNLLEARFRVKPDDINPVLEVAFDGKHLLNGDIVSPTPLILITLKDENKFLLKKDTIGMEMYLKSCESCLPKRINFNDQNLIWTPASAASSNKFAIEYRPKKLTNGTYTLTIQGKDVTGNESGKLPYSITFKVITENTVSNFYPYPNPFSTNTRFVFTLTGEIPDQIRIQIMTITGKVVKTLFKEDLGNLRIGTNLTDYAWDGTDEYGDKLANGVYLYKVDVKVASKDYEHASTAADDLFKNGYGKMYLMR